MLSKSQKTRGRQLREEIAWLEKKIREEHPITELADQKSKLVDISVEYKKLYPENHFDMKGNIYSRIADIKIEL